MYPIGLELSVENSYPVDEAAGTALIFLSGQIQGGVLIAISAAMEQDLTSEALAIQVYLFILLSGRVNKLIVLDLFNGNGREWQLCWSGRQGSHQLPHAPRRSHHITCLGFYPGTEDNLQENRCKPSS